MTSSSLHRFGAPLQRVAEQLGGWRETAAARREHDAIVRDPRMASEHTAAAAWAASQGEPGCPFCR